MIFGITDHVHATDVTHISIQERKAIKMQAEAASRGAPAAPPPTDGLSAGERAVRDEMRKAQ